MPTEAQLKEYCLDDFKLPSFIAQRRVRANGVVKCNIALGRCVYNKETKKRSIVDQKVVGVVEDNKEFGRIVFKEAFLEEYPVSTYLKTGPKRYNPNAGQPEDGASMKEAKYGHNKDNDPIPQVNLLMITSDDGMPRASYFHDGNIHDSVAFRGDMQDALNVLWANDVNGPDVAQLERTKFVWVFDRGFNVSPVMNSICERTR